MRVLCERQRLDPAPGRRRLITQAKVELDDWRPAEEKLASAACWPACHLGPTRWWRSEAVARPLAGAPRRRLVRGELFAEGGERQQRRAYSVPGV